MTPLASSMAVVSAMITPALLILSCASLIGATSQRLTRVIDRTYRTAKEFQEWSERHTEAPELREQRLGLLFEQVKRLTRRSRILQHSMVALYLSLAALVGTSVVTGVAEVAGDRLAWLPMSVGLLSVALLFYACLVLIWESRVALVSVDDEMNLILQLSKHHAAANR